MASIRGRACGVLIWNLALDENHGPHLGGFALIVRNPAPDVRRMSVRVGRQAFAHDMSRASIATFLWKP